MKSNFEFLSNHWSDIATLGKAAETDLYTDTNACIGKICEIASLVAEKACIFEAVELPSDATHADRIRALSLPEQIHEAFNTIESAKAESANGNLNSFEYVNSLLHLAFDVCTWFMKTYADSDFTPDEYKIPEEAASSDAICIDAPSSDSGDGSILIDAKVLPAINYAMQQNRFKVIQSVKLTNTTNSDINDVDLCITSSPEFSLPFSLHIDRLPANKTITISHPKLILSAEFLAGLTEKLTGFLRIEVKSEKGVIATHNSETTVLAFDEWPGLGMYPELLAAFVTPNHPALAQIIARATEFLKQWTNDTAMDGYQYQNPNRVLAQAAAIYTAIKEQSIAYCVPPASFEDAGQRVRLCDMVLQQKLGTCLDLTLLYASCLEAVGLRPLLITTRGHIFTGVWLEEKMFPDPVQDDFSLITKRLAMDIKSGVNEIAVIETTAVTSGDNISFDLAREKGEKNLTTQQSEYIIDVHRARISGIVPLPHRVHTDNGWEIHHDDTTFNSDETSAPTELGETIYVDPNLKDDNVPKKVQWERKLLDLGLRNTLINLRLSKTQLPILTRSLDALEDALADGSDFSILPKPADCALTEFSFDALSELNRSGIVQAEFENRRLRSILTEGELNKSIKGLYRASKAALEENGANTLYLALGVLRWYESRRSTRARYAPILLLPIEIVRKSAAQGYVIRMRDEEPQMNITLLEKLKQDFEIVIKGLDPLPTDEHGIDIRRVLTIVRKGIMDQPHWDVLETASIGIFSFSQFVMWNDIHNRTEDLMRNKIVRSLIEGKLCWDAQPLEVDAKVEEGDVLLPMPADASQLYAIKVACNGESFVLHGPPGTGKSQTITSLIANALAKGKRVLFVAEKMAALEVVQKRLNRIGIGPFCLELHSNKSKKKDVLEQLKVASEVTKNKTAEEYAAKADQLAAMRSELDCYVEKLHQMLSCGSDLYSLINEYEYCKDAPDIAPFSLEFISNITKADMDSLTLVLERMFAAGEEIGHPHNHPLASVACPQYTQNLRNSLKPVINAYIAQLESICDDVKRAIETFGLKMPESYEDLEKLFETAENMLCWYGMPTAWAKARFPKLYLDEMAELCEHFINAADLKAKLLEVFEPEILKLDGQALLNQISQVDANWFIPRTLGKCKLKNTLSAYAKSPIDKKNIRLYITTLRDYQSEEVAANELFKKYGKDLGMLYDGKDTDWRKIATLVSIADSSCQALYNLYGSYDVMHSHSGDLDIQETLERLRDAHAAFTDAKNAFYTLLSIIPRTDDNWIDAELTLCNNILEHADELKEWIAYSDTADTARKMNLGNVVDAYESGVDPDTASRSYRKALLQGLISIAIDENSTLNQFSGAVFNKKIEQYKRMDSEWADLSRQETYCRLASKIPNFTKEAAQSSELGILQRCIKSGGRGVSIRKLFDQIPNLLSRLCPCMLMSPISAAQYLDPKCEPFDIVVFDEASQLPTCKAVGVLARGTDAVIVGDPKQMPPTSFFATNTVDEENLDIEDLESILDDCLALNMPQSHLLWHYRSRHESLIAFSNNQFYENKLFTFPSVNDRESKVRLVHVDGVFDRGKTRTNKAEASAVVNEIKRRYAHPVLSKQSLGVVTFNISQQNLIDDLLNEACAEDPNLEKWVYGTEEPLFIKNLENVQGDERDVILFSIGFGPDESGKVFMNFGPLNRDGGWRRLNVAVSRARCEMVVFSTLRPDQLDLNRTNAEGVAALRSFLEYAENRSLALTENSVIVQKEKPDGIAVSICKALKEQGFETDLSVGHSEYRIDIGVVDPENPDRYLLGIMLDGSTYGAAKTTRDREIAQVSVLNGLGWEILRVWSMDWWDNSEKELKRILAKLQDVKNKVDITEPELEEAPEDVPALPQDDTCDESTLQHSLLSSNEFAVAPIYPVTELPSRTMTASEFIEPSNSGDLTMRINAVIEAEAPISLSLLSKRVIQSCGISRAGNRIHLHLESLVYNMKIKRSHYDGNLILWKDEQDPQTYPLYRLGTRDIKDVPVYEIANAMYVVLYEQISMAREDLLRETSKKLGFARMGTNVVACLESALDYALAQNCITSAANGTLVLTEEGSTRAEKTL
ncbi:MAG: DUF3320 domain-containing protein, partial [Clostridia bacterium]|nr:DUF3320 domain-containing protein [Clostridia bacterium]